MGTRESSRNTAGKPDEAFQDQPDNEDNISQDEEDEEDEDVEVDEEIRILGSICLFSFLKKGRELTCSGASNTRYCKDSIYIYFPTKNKGQFLILTWIESTIINLFP